MEKEERGSRGTTILCRRKKNGERREITDGER